jgi:uncharacterized protein YndB with AHSA1/START domain
MRVIKIILIAILAIVGALLAVGLIIPTFEYGNSITVQATPEKCWNVFHDTTRMKSWMPGFVSFTLTKGDHLQPNAEYLFLMEDGERMEMQEKITAVNPPESVSYLLTNDVLKSEFTYLFKANGNSTNISTNYKVTGNNLFMKAILVCMKGVMVSSDTETLAALKREIESQPN